MGDVFMLARPDILKVCREFAVYIEKLGCKVTVFTSPAKFYLAVRLSGKGTLDYVLIDVRVFQIDVFNPYKEMALMPNPVPVVVFNDPYPAPDSMASYWITKNNFYLVPLIDSESIEKLYPVFKLLETFLNSSEFNKYISVINRPEVFMSEKERFLHLDMEKFRLAHKISPSRFKVFKYFYEHLGKEISERELICLLFGNYIPEKKAVLLSYICDLRRAFRNETSMKIRIDREFKGHYAMRISLPAENSADIGFYE
ncbi:hypothetical protein [Treponema sp.]|uniref:hypothetical protein n=1 Tax=Treponema sp. TaxID=166 RepID=UPI003F05C264